MLNHCETKTHWEQAWIMSNSIEEVKDLEFTYLKQPLRKYTFESPKIRDWVEKNCYGDTILNLFAGKVKLSLFPHQKEVRVDSDSTLKNIDYSSDALDFVKRAIKENWKYDTVLLDPPYAYRKSMECYKGNHIASRFKQLLDLIPDILNEEGRVITFGYHSSAMSKRRGFEIKEICLISHGGAQHDTIATIEERVNKVISIAQN